MSVEATVLRRVPLFEGMMDRAIEAIANLATEEIVAAGHVPVTQGESGDAFYLVLGGRLSVARDAVAVQELAAGAFLGEIALVDGGPRTATVTALTEVRVAVIRREAFASLMDRYSSVRHGILVALTDRIRRDARNTVD